MNGTEEIGSINKYLVAPNKLSPNGEVIPAQYNYSYDVNNSYTVNNDNSIVTKKYVDTLTNNIHQQLLGKLCKYSLVKNSNTIEAHLNLHFNSLTDTEDSSQTGKALDQLVYNTSNNCGDTTILISNAAQQEHNGLWKLTSFQGKASNTSDIPLGSCYIIDEKIFLKRNKCIIPQGCFTLDHSVPRLDKQYEYIITKITVEAYKDIIVSPLPSRFHINDKDITQFHTTHERIFDAISTRLGLINNLEANTILAFNATITNLNTNNIILNGTNLLDRLEKLEAKLNK